MAITDKQPVGNRIFTFDALPTDVPVEGLQPGDFVLDSSTNYLYLVSSGHALVQVAAQGGAEAVQLTTAVWHDSDGFNNPFIVIAGVPLKRIAFLYAEVVVDVTAGAYEGCEDLILQLGLGSSTVSVKLAPVGADANFGGALVNAGSIWSHDLIPAVKITGSEAYSGGVLEIQRDALVGTNLVANFAGTQPTGGGHASNTVTYNILYALLP